MNPIANASDALDAACVGRTYAELEVEPARIIFFYEMAIELQTFS
ncbi:hypothetical protein [Microcoleus sp. herbarium12]